MPGAIALALLSGCANGRLETPAETALASAYDTAGQVELPPLESPELPGLHNVYRLSNTIVSGGEPENEAALRAIAEMGVRTVLSVDGKVPDHELAARHGLEYVHVPIRYNGLTHNEVMAIAKTFREREGPFYVHCFHGQHRGPAAAGLGRIILDRAPRERAAAEMRQYCGTSEKYEGLYTAVLRGELPDARATRAYVFDFPAAHVVAGVRHGMIELTRSWDTIEALSDRDWEVDPDHPDANARNEAEKVLEIFEQSIDLDETHAKREDFRQLLIECAAEADKLLGALKSYEAGDTAAGERAHDLVVSIGGKCSECHSNYRNSN